LMLGDYSTESSTRRMITLVHSDGGCKRQRIRYENPT
jgi:hypothetical protein